jgi:hypothetical protein
VQHQPGLRVSEFEFDLRKDGSTLLTAQQPQLTEWPDGWRYVGALEQDLKISLKLENK